MEIRILQNENEIGEAAGRIICDFVNANPSCVLGFATGASPVPTYNYIAKQFSEGKVSFKDVSTFIAEIEKLLGPESSGKLPVKPVKNPPKASLEEE